MLIRRKNVVDENYVMADDTSAAYESQWETTAYLNAYYRCTEDNILNRWSLKHLKEIFDNCEKGDGVVLDVGTGPVLCYLISGAQRFDKIYVSDYSKFNREELNDWLNEKGSFDWTDTFKYVASLYGNEVNWEQFENGLRSAINDSSHILHCDVLQDHVFEPDFKGQADVLMSCLTLEAAVKTPSEWSRALGRISSYLKPGGMVVLLVATAETFYKVGSHTFPVCYITTAQVQEALRENGFQDFNPSELPNPEEGSDAATFLIVSAIKTK